MPSTHWPDSHPFSPWIGDYQQTWEHIASALYWTGHLEFYTWPCIQIFSGASQLLWLLLEVDSWELSRCMEAFNSPAHRRAVEFWAKVMPALAVSVPHP